MILCQYKRSKIRLMNEFTLSEEANFQSSPSMDWTVIPCLNKHSSQMLEQIRAVLDLRSSNKDSDEFCKAQQDGTLDSKPLRETLYTIVRPSRRYM